jgi:lipoyl-dependent peroxiredoxin
MRRVAPCNTSFANSPSARVASGPRPGGGVEEMAQIAHEEVCPYSRATRGNMEVNVRVI